MLKSTMHAPVFCVILVPSNPNIGKSMSEKQKSPVKNALNTSVGYKWPQRLLTENHHRPQWWIISILAKIFW